MKGLVNSFKVGRKSAGFRTQDMTSLRQLKFLVGGKKIPFKVFEYVIMAIKLLTAVVEKEFFKYPSQ